jgi:hypothetical protein
MGLLMRTDLRDADRLLDEILAAPTAVEAEKLFFANMGTVAVLPPRVRETMLEMIEDAIKAKAFKQDRDDGDDYA